MTFEDYKKQTLKNAYFYLGRCISSKRLKNTKSATILDEVERFVTKSVQNYDDAVCNASDAIFDDELKRQLELMGFVDENGEVYFPISRGAQKCDVLIKICAFNNVFEDIWQMIERFKEIARILND